jgi:hypothetical protein
MRRITFKTIRSGQLGPYQDSILIGEILVEWWSSNTWIPNSEFRSEKVKAVAKAFWSIYESSDPGCNWASLILTDFYIGTEPGTWIIKARAEYND